MSAPGADAGRPIAGSRGMSVVAIVLSIAAALLVCYYEMTYWGTRAAALAAAMHLTSSPGAVQATAGAAGVDIGWYAPAKTAINDLTGVASASGVYGFIFDTSDTPDAQYGMYNWCNMPHVRRSEYVVPPKQYELQYVELIHRHHKRTPYAANSFPVEPYHWDCDDGGLFYYAEAKQGPQAARTFWSEYLSPVNPFKPAGWTGTCQFPQITRGGLQDSWQHGADLYGVYHDLLGFLPSPKAEWEAKVSYRVTNNVITSQVAGMVVNGMWGTTKPVPLTIEAAGIDSLEPQYSCPTASALFANIQSSRNAAWAQHLSVAAPLFATLDAISGVPSSDPGFHASFDHYYDNLSARQCHGKPLPCNASTTTCVSQSLTDAVYRWGQWEYSATYRDAPTSLAASAASLGVWIAELAAHLRAAVHGDGASDGVRYWHNVAHDGSMARLLSVLQVDVMVWPGMGSEVVFELWRDKSEAGVSGYRVRVLWGGKVLKSSSPTLGVMDMVPVETVLAYFDGLVGEGAALVMGKCNGSIPIS